MVDLTHLGPSIMEQAVTRLQLLSKHSCQRKERVKSRGKILLRVLSHGGCCGEEMVTATAPSMGHKIMLLIFLCLLEDDNFVHTGLWGEMGTRI